MTAPATESPSLLTYEEVAQLTRLSVRTIRRKVQAGELRAVAVSPGHPRITAHDLGAWLAGLPAAGGAA